MTAAIALMALGALFVAAAVHAWRKDRRLQAVGQRADGVVTGLRWHGAQAFPVFRFQTRDGRGFQVEGRLGTTPPMYRVGAAVRVLYDPANREHARIDRAAFGTGPTVLFVLVGLVFAAAGVWLARDPQ